MRESNLQQKCITYLKKNSIYHINIYGSGRTGKGTADLICCINGKFVAFELKVDGNKPSAAQKIRCKQVIKSGGLSYYVYSIEKFIEIIEEIKRGLV